MRVREGVTARKRAWRYAVMVALAAAVAFFVVRGCAFMPWNRVQDKERVRVTVTRDLGSEVLKDETVEVREGSSAMLALQEAAEVETSYGGGFIQGIDGLSSGYGAEDSRKADWFYYLNGQMAEVGAGELVVKEGDWLVFDYHSWEYSMFTPAFAGCFPEPFVHGYGEPPERCLVLYAPGWRAEGEDVAARLEEAGAPSCAAGELNPEWEPEEGEYAVLVGTFAELSANSFLAEANRNARRLGLAAYFEGNDMLVVGADGVVAGRYSSGAGVVEAVGPRLGEEGSALVVTGTDAAGLKAALALLSAWDNRSCGPVMAMIAHADGDPDAPVR